MEVKGDKDKILIASCYRAPNTDQSEFLNSYTELLESLKKERCSMIIGLDHNLDPLKCNSHQKNTEIYRDKLHPQFDALLY